MRAKSTVLSPPTVFSFSIGVFETAASAAGTVTVTWNGILNSGSSQQGNASRAASASNWV